MNCSPAEMQVIRLRLSRGSCAAMALFAAAARSARVASAGRAIAIALIDEAVAIAAVKSRQSCIVLRLSRGRKRLQTLHPSSCAHAVISSQRITIASTTDPIRATDSCIVNFSFLSCSGEHILLTLYYYAGNGRITKRFSRDENESVEKAQ